MSVTLVGVAVDRDWRMLIGGELVTASGGERLAVLDPSRGESVTTVPSGTPADVDRAVAAARAAQPAWWAIGASARAAAVHALADRIEAAGEELARLDTVDNGSPISVLRGDHVLAVEQLRYFAGLALELRGETVPTADHDSIDFSVREPFGVVGRIVPFNHPLLFAASRVAAPLVAGNTVVLKPAEQTSLSALRLGELAAEVLPPGVLNVVTGLGPVVGDRLVRHPDVRRIAFTGGTDVGLRIQRAAAESGVKTVTLELGGKNPLIVFPDADVDDAVAGAVRGMNFSWQGQSCGSTSRLYVHRSLFAEVTARVAAALDDMVVGDPQDPGTDVGAIVSSEQYLRVRRYLAAGTAQPGVRLLAGGLPEPGTVPPGWFLRPTLLAVDGDDDISVVREEIFGPILVAMPFDDYDEVIARANGLDLGLTASVWTRDLSVALRAVRDLQAGYVWVNWSSSHIPGTSFGGVKNSGIGREESLAELYSYTQAKNAYVKF